MQFKSLVFLATALSFGQAQAALTANDVVNAVHNITNLSSGALAVAKTITPATALPSALKIVDDFRQIVAAVADDVKVLQGITSRPKFPDNDQRNICNALSGFVKVHQELLNTLIGQKGLLSVTPLTQPIAAILRILETGVDKLAKGVIALVPTCAAKAGDELKQLDRTLDKAVNTFTPKPLNTTVPGVIGVPASGPPEGQ